NRDTILEEFVTLKVFVDVEPIRRVVGENLHLLRKMSSIQKSGYYKDKSFLSGLIKKNVEKGWNLKVEHGVIVVDENNVELVLKLLNNERVESQINQEVFDAVVKKKVG
ncbi:Kiwa anti-phage protein KwaB-like domain-containing protein, partial [Candidatus Methylomirabilis sp.]|uniref:Kiwa anti-phage protein KwaB-like domain-containing protein n=1 Tax=Candidatus Methylomirabilis sp. TaxID=2032687 RepID=UPI003C7501D2